MADLAPDVLAHLESFLAPLLTERGGSCPPQELAARLVRTTYLADLPGIDRDATLSDFRERVLAWVLDQAYAGHRVELREGLVRLAGPGGRS